MIKKVLHIYMFIFIILVTIRCKKDNVSLDEEQKFNIECYNNNIDSLKINQIQVLGSHNSYRIKTYEPIFNVVNDLLGFLGDINPFREWDYTHLPIDEQLENHNMRSFELDIYYDPRGWKYYNRQGNVFVGESRESNEPLLQQPGFKMLHIHDFDYMTHYLTFKQGLQAIKNWSDANSSHIPLFILIEPKGASFLSAVSFIGLATPKRFTSEAADALEEEVLEIFPRDKIITPDDVRGNYATLEEAVLNKNWPTIGAARGKVMFILIAGGDVYAEGYPSLDGRLLFISSDEGRDETAVIVKNASSEVEEIRELVAKGYIIRTRADAGTEEARSGDTIPRYDAYRSGAQIISTDYYIPDARHTTSNEWSNYSVQWFDNASGRINPINTDMNPCIFVEN